MTFRAEIVTEVTEDESVTLRKLRSRARQRTERLLADAVLAEALGEQELANSLLVAAAHVEAAGKTETSPAGPFRSRERTQRRTTDENAASYVPQTLDGETRISSLRRMSVPRLLGTVDRFVSPIEWDLWDTGFGAIHMTYEMRLQPLERLALAWRGSLRYVEADWLAGYVGLVGTWTETRRQVAQVRDIPGIYWYSPERCACRPAHLLVGLVVEGSHLDVVDNRLCVAEGRSSVLQNFGTHRQRFGFLSAVEPSSAPAGRMWTSGWLRPLLSWLDYRSTGRAHALSSLSEWIPRGPRGLPLSVGCALIHYSRTGAEISEGRVSPQTGALYMVLDRLIFDGWVDVDREEGSVERHGGRSAGPRVVADAWADHDAWFGRHQFGAGDREHGSAGRGVVGSLRLATPPPVGRVSSCAVALRSVRAGRRRARHSRGDIAPVRLRPGRRMPGQFA
jgi:hypothetical protein